MALDPRSLARRYGPRVLVEAWASLGPTLGHARRRVLIQPLIALVLAVLETASLLAVVRLILLLVDGGDAATFSIFGHDASVTFTQLGAIAIVGSLTTALVRAGESHYTAHTGAMAVTGARRLVITGFFDAEWERTREGRLGELQQFMGVNCMQASAPVTLLAAVALSGLQLLLFVVLILVIAPPVAVLFGLVGGFTTLVFGPLRHRNKQNARDHADGLASLQLSATSYAQLNRELAVFGVGSVAAARLEEEAQETGLRLQRLRNLSRLLPGLYQQVLIGAVAAVVVGARALEIDATAFGTAAILGVRSMSYVQQLNSSTVAYMESKPLLDDLGDLVRTHRLLRTEDGSADLGSIRTLELLDTGYRYPDGTVGMEAVDLQLQAGDWVGIVGPSGSGKTTLANLLVGLIAPTTGRYLVNGCEARTFTRASWARQVAIVSQEPTLLRATIEENIAFHRPTTIEAVRRAATLAGVRDEIDQLPGGFDTLVGEGGASLSGGQRQRIAIARALLNGPSCLVLDEPTSALDAANEALIDESIARIPEDTIVIVVSHRPRLLERCTRIITMAGGRIVPGGS